MRIPTTTMMICFILCLNIVGVLEKLHIWNWNSFFMGFAATLPMLTLWMSRKLIGFFFTLLSVALFFYVVSGEFNQESLDRVFMSGASFGFWVGILPAYYFQKVNVLKFAHYLCMGDGYFKTADKIASKLEYLKQDMEQKSKQ